MSQPRGLPAKVAMGWIDTNVKRDAVETAKGYATRHFDAPTISWYNVAPFLGGYLYEVHEGGPGKSYLPAAIAAMARGLEPAWFQVGDRAFSVALRDGRPYCILHPEGESKAVLDSTDGVHLKPSSAMEHVVLNGVNTLTAGAAFLGTGFLFLAATLGFYVTVEATSPDPRTVDIDSLPHRQWNKVSRVMPNQFVESLKLTNSQWNATLKPISRPGNRADTPQDPSSPQRPVGFPNLPNQDGSAARPAPTAPAAGPSTPLPVPSGAPAASRPPIRNPQTTPVDPSGIGAQPPPRTTPDAADGRRPVQTPHGGPSAAPIEPPAAASAAPSSQSTSPGQITTPLTPPPQDSPPASPPPSNPIPPALPAPSPSQPTPSAQPPVSSQTPTPAQNKPTTPPPFPKPPEPAKP